jgi:hypothetical protein
MNRCSSFFSVRSFGLGLSLACLWMAACQTWANESQHIYRCGNSYTNQPNSAQNCKLVNNTASRVIVIEGVRVQGQQAVSPHVGSGANGAIAGMKVDSADQHQRDAQAQAVLQAELQKTQQQHAELLREWNNGEPERRADEFRQPQKYQDRVAQLRGALQRTEADIAGLKRELSRLPAANLTGAKP